MNALTVILQITIFLKMQEVKITTISHRIEKRRTHRIFKRKKKDNYSNFDNFLSFIFFTKFILNITKSFNNWQ